MKSKIFKTALILSLFSLVFISVGVVSAKKYRSKSPWIGIQMQSIDEDMREALDLDDIDGVLIVSVADDSPADDAGLRRKDIIIKFDGKKTTEPDFLADMVGEKEIGDEVNVVYIRRGEEKTTTVEIGRRPRSESYGLIFEPGDSKGIFRKYSFSSSRDSYIGTAVQSLGEQLGEYFGVKDGLLITEVYEDSPAEEAGLKAGDVIISADGESVAETFELIEIISEKEEGDEVEIGYIRRGDKKKVTVEVAEDSNGLNAFYAPHSLSRFTIPRIPDIPDIPRIPSIGHFLHDYNDDHDYFDNDEYEEAMEDYRDELKNMKRELKEMKRELGEIKSKLE